MDSYFRQRIQDLDLETLRQISSHPDAELIPAIFAARPPDEVFQLRNELNARVRKILGLPDLLELALERGRAATEKLLLEEGGAWTREEVKAHLNLTDKELDLGVEDHEILCVQGRYPRCQFTDTGTVHGIERVVAGMAPHGPVVTLSFLISPSPRLAGDARPIDLLRQGRLLSVIYAVESYGEMGG